MKKVLEVLSLIFAASAFGGCSSFSDIQASVASDQPKERKFISKLIKDHAGVAVTNNPGSIPETAGEQDIQDARYVDVRTGKVYSLDPATFGQKVNDRTLGVSLYFGRPLFQFLQRADTDFCSLTESQGRVINRLLDDFQRTDQETVVIAEQAPHALFPAADDNEFDTETFVDEAVLNDIPACQNTDAKHARRFLAPTIIEPIIKEMVRRGYLVSRLKPT